MTRAKPDDLGMVTELFHGCALAAFVDRAVIAQDWPCVESTRMVAFRYYENALATESEAKQLRAAPGDKTACHVACVEV